MPHVVFLRAANVGGKNVFRPAQLVADLAHLDVVNVGAAGTFVVRGPASAAAIRREILARLPFEPGIAVRPAREIVALVQSRPFARVKLTKDLRAWVAVLCGRAAARPTLPLDRPAGKQWSVRVDRLEGAYAIGLLQRREKVSLYPNQVVEQALGGRPRRAGGTRSSASRRSRAGRTERLPPLRRRPLTVGDAALGEWRPSGANHSRIAIESRAEPPAPLGTSRRRGRMIVCRWQ